MCEYCSCRIQPSIARFGEEHERIDAVAASMATAHARDDRPGMVRLAVELVALLGPHVAREEQGLFPELDAYGALDHTEALRTDHEELDAVFAAVARGELTPAVWTAIPAALDRLSRHICREEYDVFPAAIQMLDGTSWDRVEAFCDAHAQADAVVAPVGRSPLVLQHRL